MRVQKRCPRPPRQPSLPGARPLGETLGLAGRVLCRCQSGAGGPRVGPTTGAPCLGPFLGVWVRASALGDGIIGLPTDKP